MITAAARGAGEMTYRVADGLEEEEREQAPDASLSGGEGHAEGEDHTGDGVEAQQERGVDVPEEDHANEAASHPKVSVYVSCGRP